MYKERAHYILQGASCARLSSGLSPGPSLATGWNLRSYRVLGHQLALGLSLRVPSFGVIVE
jgi:hypothetical protein